MLRLMSALVWVHTLMGIGPFSAQASPCPFLKGNVDGDRNVDRGRRKLDDDADDDADGDIKPTSVDAQEYFKELQVLCA